MYIREIDISKINVPSYNFYSCDNIEILKKDIEENGLYHSLLVREKNGRFELITGKRRLKALSEAHFKKAPCTILEDIDDITAEIMLIKSNSTNRELSAEEKLMQVKRLTELYNLKKNNGTKEKGKVRDLVARDMKISPVQIYRYTSINKKLIDHLKDMLFKGEINFADAEKLVRLSKEEQEEVYHFFKDDEVKTTREALEMLNEDDIGKELDLEALLKSLGSPKLLFRSSKLTISISKANYKKTSTGYIFSGENFSIQVYRSMLICEEVQGFSYVGFLPKDRIKTVEITNVVNSEEDLILYW